MISLSNVHKNYPPDQSALKGISAKIFSGDFVFLAGASGAGKSTLLRLLYGAESASSGEVIVGGRNLDRVEAGGLAALRRQIGFIFQDYKLLPHRTIVENVAFGLEVQGIERELRESLAQRLLASLGLEDRLHALPRMLSGGEQQRVAVARALLHRPRMILADEPTGNLDPEMSNVIFDLLMEANAAGVTVIVATHNLSIIEELNYRAIILDRGKIIGDFERPRSLAA